MSEIFPVNGQITDAVTQTVTLLTGQAPSQAFGMMDAVMVETMGMAMYTAVNRQQNAGMVGNAAVTAACAKMLSLPPFPLAAPPPGAEPPPVPPASGVVNPLPGPPPASDRLNAAMTATLQAGSALALLRQIARGSGPEAAAARQALAELTGMPVPVDADMPQH